MLLLSFSLMCMLAWQHLRLPSLSRTKLIGTCAHTKTVNCQPRHRVCNWVHSDALPIDFFICLPWVLSCLADHWCQLCSNHSEDKAKLQDDFHMRFLNVLDKVRANAKNRKCFNLGRSYHCPHMLSTCAFYGFSLWFSSGPIVLRGCSFFPYVILVAQGGTVYFGILRFSFSPLSAGVAPPGP